MELWWIAISCNGQCRYIDSFDRSNRLKSTKFAILSLFAVLDFFTSISHGFDEPWPYIRGDGGRLGNASTENSLSSAFLALSFSGLEVNGFGWMSLDGLID